MILNVTPSSRCSCRICTSGSRPPRTTCREMLRQIPASGSRGPQSQPNWQCAFRICGKPGVASEDCQQGRFSFSSRIYFSGDSNRIRISFSPARSIGRTSHSQIRCILSARPTCRPLIHRSQSVSRPSQCRSSASAVRSSSDTEKDRTYSQSFSIRAKAFVSLSRQKGSSMLPSRRRSPYTVPGTCASCHRSSPAALMRQTPFSAIVFIPIPRFISFLATAFRLCIPFMTGKVYHAGMHSSRSA